MLGNLLRNKTSSSGFEKSSEHSDFSSVVPNVPVYCKAASTGTTKTAAGALLDTAVNVGKAFGNAINDFSAHFRSYIG